MNVQDGFRIAVGNIAAQGDTDVFPSPFERHICYDNADKVLQLLTQIHTDLDRALAEYPPQNIDTLAPAGYTGFRWVTQIDPIWNAYFLGLVVSLADAIESRRLPESENIVYSYRFHHDPTTNRVFNDSSWRDYKRRAVELSNEFEFALATDIADFYPRIYHHRLGNELKRLGVSSDVPSRILRLLTHFSKTVSYGLPVGGPAARILAELALHPADLHLHRRGIKFCRYADDYHLFAKSKPDAYRILAFLSDKLFNEGLSLNKAKTKIISSKELKQTSQLLDPDGTAMGAIATPETQLLSLSIRFDPYLCGGNPMESLDDVLYYLSDSGVTIDSQF